MLAAGLRSGQARLRPGTEARALEWPNGAQPDDRMRELEHALELERTRRRAAEDLAAERAHPIQTLESALAALQAHYAGPAPNPGRVAPSFPVPPFGVTDTAKAAPQPGMLPMVPRRPLAKRQLSQEEKAAIIGRALSRQRPPKRRWL